MVQSGSGAARKAREQVGAHNIAGQPNNGDVAGNGGEHFADSIRKARQQVDAHVNAGHDHFEDVLGKVAIGSGASRSVPDVHLTRFAAYFVALNADQSKPESTALDTPMRGCNLQPIDAVSCRDVVCAR